MPPKTRRSQPSRRSFGRIRKLPSGRWQASYIGPDTALHKAAHTFDTKTRAEGWLAAERTLIDLETWEPPAHRHVPTTTSEQEPEPEPTSPILFGPYAERVIATRVLSGLSDQSEV